MRHSQVFVRASAITVVCVVLFFNNALAVDAVPWLKLSEEARFAFVIGFNAGVSHGAVSAGAEAQRIYVPSTGFDQSQSFEEMVNSPEAKRNWENSVRIHKAAMKEAGLRFLHLRKMMTRKTLFRGSPVRKSLQTDGGNMMQKAGQVPGFFYGQILGFLCGFAALLLLVWFCGSTKVLQINAIAE